MAHMPTQSRMPVDRRTFIHGGAALAGLLATPALARKAQRTDNLGRASLQIFLDQFAKDRGLPGLAASYARGTDDAQFFATGVIAKNSKRAVDPDTLFRIYSMTKPVTGMAAMMLIEDGKLALDQPLSDILPLFGEPRVLIDGTKDLASRPAAGPITIRHLLTHTAGLGYNIVTKGPLLKAYEENGIIAGAISKKNLPGFAPVTPAGSLAIFADRLSTLPLIADPGTRWSYSVSIDLLGRVIEVVSGMAFDAFLKSRIFDPLGMASTTFTVPGPDLPRLTTNYAVTPIGKFPIDPNTDSVFAAPPVFPAGGAGLVSSVRDYDRFLAMLAGQGALGRTRLLKAETAKLAMSNLLPAAVDTTKTMLEGAGFGAGGRITLTGVAGGRSAGTFGWGGAAATTAWVDPVAGIRAAGYAQYMPDSSIPFTREFVKMVYAA
jgi:CubicO group peptidase (beta-lactamase class C family)